MRLFSGSPAWEKALDWIENPTAHFRDYSDKHGNVIETKRVPRSSTVPVDRWEIVGVDFSPLDIEDS